MGGICNPEGLRIREDGHQAVFAGLRREDGHQAVFAGLRGGESTVAIARVDWRMANVIGLETGEDCRSSIDFIRNIRLCSETRIPESVFLKKVTH
jgi:hypothetical protein